VTFGLLSSPNQLLGSYTIWTASWRFPARILTIHVLNVSA
jgi:hypothetical protein